MLSVLQIMNAPGKFVFDLKDPVTVRPKDYHGHVPASISRPLSEERMNNLFAADAGTRPRRPSTQEHRPQVTESAHAHSDQFR